MDQYPATARAIRRVRPPPRTRGLQDAACTVEAVFGHLRTGQAKAATTGKGNPGEQVRILKPTGLGAGSCAAGPGWSELV